MKKNIKILLDKHCLSKKDIKEIKEAIELEENKQYNLGFLDAMKKYRY